MARDIESALVVQMSADIRKLERAMNRALGVSTDTATKIERRLGDAGRRASSSFDMRGPMQQLSQVAQSATATGNPVQALAVQLPDLAAGFGPVGMAAGIAAGALLPFAANLIGAGEEVESVEDRLARARDMLGQYREAQELANLSTAEATARWGELAPAIQAGNAAYAEITRAGFFTGLTEAMDAFAESYGSLDTAMRASGGGRSGAVYFREIDATIEEVRDEFDLTEEAAQRLVEALAAIGDAATFDEKAKQAAAFSAALLDAFGSAEKIPPELVKLAETARAAAELAGEFNAELAKGPALVTEMTTLAGNLEDIFEKLGEPFVERMREALGLVTDMGDRSLDAYRQYQNSRRAGVFVADQMAARSEREAAAEGILSLIRHVEGTGPGTAGYNETLDRGRWTGGPVNLTSMTLNEVLALQDRMRTPENRALYGDGAGSSAVGAYQIVSTTLRDLIRQLGLDPSTTLFDQGTQDRMAMQLVRQRQPQGLSGFRSEWQGFEARGTSWDTIQTALGVQSPPTVDPETARAALEAVREAEEAAVKSAAAREMEAAAVEAVRAAYDGLRGSMDPTIAAQNALAEGQRVVNEALDRGAITAAEAAAAMGALQARYSAEEVALATQAIIEGGAAAAEAAQEAAQGARDMTRGLIDDLLQGATAAEALGNVLGKIGSRFIDMGLDNLFSAPGVGNFFGSLFGGFRAAGGPVSAGRAYVVGERGPELFMPSTGGSILPNGFPAVPELRGFASQQQAPARVEVDARVYMDEGGQWQAEVVKISGAVAQQGLRSYDTALPARVKDISRNPRVR